MNRTSPHNQLCAASRGGTKSENKTLIIHNRPPPCHRESKETIQQNKWFIKGFFSFALLFSAFPIHFMASFLSFQFGWNHSLCFHLRVSGRQTAQVFHCSIFEWTKTIQLCCQKEMILSFFLSLLSICFSPPSSFFHAVNTHSSDLAINSVRFNKRLHLSRCARQFGGLLLGWRGPTCPKNNKRLWPLTYSCFNHIWFSIYFTDDLKGVISLRKSCTLKVLYVIYDFTKASKYHNLFADI